MRQSKRLVENKFQTIVELSETQSRDLKSLSFEKLCLEDQLSHKTANLEAIQQELVRGFDNNDVTLITFLSWDLDTDLVPRLSRFQMVQNFPVMKGVPV